MIPPQTFKLIIDSVVWAFKHTMRNIAETGLNILLEMWKNIEQSSPEVAQGNSNNNKTQSFFTFYVVSSRRNQ